MLVSDDSLAFFTIVNYEWNVKENFTPSPSSKPS